ncbi:TolC family protein [Pseudoruegeria sp. SK021]|uniref:TolC family protein n=1 Tax=Pseudoruegeria sp. SK021 TaxID=1933035 RepID=UPI000A229791|nr:TolC family protein [Pseudoruegeria sp. SK021]OSP53971.1 agglutination protein [Pseudoruegeria sp. SK021]
MRLRYALSGLGLVAGICLSPLQASALTLEDAIRTVLETNPEIGAAEANKQATEFELDQARSFRMPKFELEAWAGSSFDDGTRSTDASSASNPIEGYRVTGRVSQVLYDGFRIRSEIERQAYRVDAAALRVLERSEFLSLEAIRLYADVLRSQSMLNLARQNLDYHLDVFARLDNAFGSGAIPVGDVQQARERVLFAEDTMINFELEAQGIENEFLQVVSIEPKALGTVPSISSQVHGSVEQALSVARRQNPTIRFSQADVGSAEARWRVADANRAPTVHLEAEVSAGEDVGGFEGQLADAEVGVVLRYELQGDRKRAQRQEQIRRISESRSTLLHQTRLVEREVRDTWDDWQAAQRRVGTLTRQADLSLQLRETYEEEYTVGSRSLLDILNTQNSLFQSQVNLVNARSLEIYIRYRLLAATGTLLKTMGIQPPEDATDYARQFQNAPDVGSVGEPKRFDARSFTDWRRSVEN